MNRIRIVNGKGWHKDNNGNMVLSPYIVLGGKVLAKAGFSQGDKVKIKSQKGIVTVELIKKVEDNKEKVEENANGRFADVFHDKD